MKKLYSLLLLLVAGTALASITANQKYLLNNKMGPVARTVGLGDIIDTAGVGTNLASGKIVVGDVSNVATARTLTGDVTITNAGVTAIGAGKVADTMLKAPAASGLGTVRVAHAIWDPSGTAAQGTVGAHSLSVALPAGAIIIRSFIYVVTAQVSTSNDGTVAISCETANNILSAADKDGSGAGTFIDGVSDGAVANLKPITSACNITATTAVHDTTAGKWDIFVTYVVHS